jgi:signal transduction histidine kinase
MSQEAATSRVAGAQALATALQEVLVNALEVPNAQQVTVTGTRRDEAVFIEVSSDGADLRREELLELFQPFERPRAKHLGVGLAIAKRLIDACGGHIRADLPGEGRMVVEISVPCVAT